MKFSRSLFAALAVTGILGCGSSADTRVHVPTIPVKGKLLVDGKPFGPCVVYFAALNPDPDPKKSVPTVTGQVKSDGSFVLTTYASGDGAPEGTYHVSLGADISNILAKVPACKPLDVEIEDSEASPPELEIQLEATGETQTGPPIGLLQPDARAAHALAA
jgi:hypothetical protein